jgi:[amino group carrier protein]-lysine/ornithine hydrolase
MPPLPLAGPAAAWAFLREVVAIPSPSGQEGEVARAFVAALAPHADRAFVDEIGNAVAVVGSGRHPVTLLAHLDTVAGWPPVVGDENLLHGRGSVDAKGPAVALAAAFAAVAPSVADALTLRFVAAVAEEHPSSRGARHAMLAYPRPRTLIVGEPSGSDAFTLGYKGSLRLRVGSERAIAHGARDEATAAEVLLDALATLRAFAAATPGERAFDRLQISVASLETGDDGLRATASARVGWRLPLDWSPARLRDAVTALALPGVTLRWHGAETAVRGERDGALARAFRVAIRAEGGAATSKVKTGTSDWNVVAPVWPADTVAYGPGDAALDHTPEERIERSDFERSIRVLTRVLRALATQAAVRRPLGRSSS